MDIITQGLLGASTFGVIKNRDIGSRSLLIGAIAGISPDFDFLLTPFYSEVEHLIIHRSFSHSLILAAIISPILGEIFHRVYENENTRSSWYLAFFLAISTQSLLDLCTTYGTKLLSPISDHIFSTNNIHVCEPFYTLILLLGVIFALRKGKSNIQRRRALRRGLIISSCYLLWTFAAKGIANYEVNNHLKSHNLSYDKLIISPTPLNSYLWHGIAKVDSGYFFTTYSLFDAEDKIETEFVYSEESILNQFEPNSLVDGYLAYTQDFPLVQKGTDGIVRIYAVKYGPVNYSGSPEFIYPLCIDQSSTEEDSIYIGHPTTQIGPVKNFRELIERIKGV